jgi:hypothetical protein
MSKGTPFTREIVDRLDDLETDIDAAVVAIEAAATDITGVATSLGEADDTITAANLSNLATTSAQAKLGRIATDVVAIDGIVDTISTAVVTTIPTLHAVPTKDATTDANMRDVIGKKDDTAVTTVGTQKSLIGYAKGIITNVALIPTTAMRGTDNAALASDMGTAADDHADATLFGWVDKTYDMASSAHDDAATAAGHNNPDAAGTAAGLHATTDGLIGDVQTAVDLIPTTAMRGTDNAFLASVGGALNDAAAEGAVTDADTAMAYIKQLVTAIQLIPTTAMRGTDSAFLASVGGALNDAAAEGAVTDADTAMAYIKQLVTAIQLIPTTAMRGTDNAALASVLGALDNAAAEGAVTDVDTTMAYIKQLVTAIQLIPTTAMRGTDSAFLASVGGALDDAAVYASTTDKTVMAYVKGLVDAGIVAYGTVNDAGATATDFITTLTEATDDHYVGASMLFLAGVNKGKTPRMIEDYVGGTKSCNFDHITGLSWGEAPANGDAFIILPTDYALAYIVSQNLSINTAVVTDIPNTITAVKAKTDLILPGTKFATKTSTSHLTSGDLFSFEGTIGIVSIIGRVTTALEAATAQTIKLTCTPDALSATDLCATKDANAFAVGSLLTITGTLADAMIGTTAVGCAVAQASMITATCVTNGKISVVYGTSGSKDGAIVWEILWIPQTPGATLVAA